MNFEYLNQMVKYIEENLTENIEYKKLAQIVGVSEYNLQSKEKIAKLKHRELTEDEVYNWLQENK